MGEGTALTNEQSAAQLLILPEQINDLYKEFAGAHARSSREVMRAELSLADAEKYEHAVDDAGLWRKESEYWQLCCDLLGQTLDASPEEFGRYHRRYDALRGMSVSMLVLSSLRLVEHPELRDPYEPTITTAPFEAHVIHTGQTSAFPHWLQDKGHLDVDYLTENFPREAPAFKKHESEKRIAYFTKARKFLGGSLHFQGNEIPLLDAFADSITANFGHLNRPFEREYTLLAGGFVKRAVSVARQRTANLEVLVRSQMVTTAFGLHGVHFDSLSPKGKDVFLAGVDEISEELIYNGQPDLPEVTAKWARAIHQVESGRVFRLDSSHADAHSFGGIGIA